MFCLDTNIVIRILNRRAPAQQERLEAEILAGTRLALPALVFQELHYGAAKSQNPARNRARIEDFRTAIPETIGFDAEDAAEAGDIRAYLESIGKPIGPYDLLIAAQARRRDAVLVTLNRCEFERVPGLMVTDWAT